MVERERECGVIRARDIIHRIVLFESVRVTWRALNSPLFDTSRQEEDAKIKKREKESAEADLSGIILLITKTAPCVHTGAKNREGAAPSRENVSARAYLEENPGKKANAYLFLERSLPNV